MSSIRARLLVSFLITLAISALLMGFGAYRNVLRETEALFDYQLRQMALSLRDQGEIASAQAHAFIDPEFDFVVQIWTVDGRTIYASRPHNELPASAVLGFADVAVRGETWRTYSVVTPQRVIQVAQPNHIRRRLAAQAALRSAVPLLAMAPLMAAVGWWLVALAFKPLRRLAGDVRSRDAESLKPTWKANPLGTRVEIEYNTPRKARGPICGRAWLPSGWLAHSASHCNYSVRI